MTTEQLDELKAQIARQHELLAYYAPAYMQPEIAALWTDARPVMEFGTLDGLMQRAAELEAQS